MDFALDVRHLANVSSADDPSQLNFLSTQEILPLHQSLARFFRARVRDASDVDDLVQEVFARLAARQSDDAITHVERYAFQTAATVLVDRARRRRVRQSDRVVEFDPESHGGHDADPFRILSGREGLTQARAALLALPERTRAVFVLHRLEGMKYREIADHIGISVSAVEKHMIRAIQHVAASCKGVAYA